MIKNFFPSNNPVGPNDRVDGRAKVTGTATYAAEHKAENIVYGFLVGSTIAKGRIKSIDAKSAERAPGVRAIVTYLNSPKVPGYQIVNDPSKPKVNLPLHVFHDNEILFYDQPIALVIADTYEQVRYAATLVKAQYEKTPHHTSIEENLSKAITPADKESKDYKRGEEEAYKKAAVKIEETYSQPIEVHSPIELGSIIAQWEGEDKVTVYTKTQGVQDTQQSIMDAFKLPLQNITVHAEFVGGAFGSALRTWPFEIAAIIGAKKVGRPLKLVLSREEMFTNIGSRPAAIQKMGLGATRDGKLVGITHEAFGHTSSNEQFTEATVSISQLLYACPNVNTRYKIVPLDVCTPIWMRGPGEATGSFALESAMDELAYKLNIDPIEFRLGNHADKDPESNLPWSSKYLKECYQMGTEKIGWSQRHMKPGTLRDGEWFVGYGMGTGTFGAFRWGATVKARLSTEGNLFLQCSVNDMGPGTATMMTKIATDVIGLPANKITVQMGRTGLPSGPTQGGSATTSNVGSAVYEVCSELKAKITELAGKEGSIFMSANNKNIKVEDLIFSDGEILLAKDPSVKISYTDLFKQNNLPGLEITKESKGDGPEQKKYSMHSFSTHFVKLRVHPATGIIHIDHVVSCADAGTIVSPKTAASQMIGGGVGGIGMALMEEAVIDQRFGRIINNNFADYHVPVNADIPNIDVLFVNKKDPYTNPMGSKGLGEIALIGMAAAVANAVFNATGKRIRSLPITPDKLI
jgi:xanthine dehydrogenase YagR molybdenum-binding subunit